MYICFLLNFIAIQEFDMLTFLDFIFVICIVLFLLLYEGIYQFRYDFWQETFVIFKAISISFFIVLAIMTLTKDGVEYSRWFTILYFCLVILLFPLQKRYIKRVLFRFALFQKKVKVIGTAKQKRLFRREFLNNWYLGYYYITKDDFDIVLIVAKDMKLKEFNKKIAEYNSNNREVFVVPYITDINFAYSNILEYSNIRLNTIQIENRLLIPSNILIKYIFDKVVSFFVLPIFLLIHVIVILAIKCDSQGSIWFKQHRLGRADKSFEVYKYRTMYENGDELLGSYLKKNPDEIRYYEKFHKYKNDPRITRVGRFLRSTSLDELPQILNVIKGDMSLIGPRPYMVSESKKLEKNKHFILKVKPGITGLWQVSGRNRLTFQERKELEMYYIRNWSLWKDLVILIKTIKVVFGKVGAK
jgi:undecaprenyl-phosphate galactose phosphotransferase